MSEYGSFMHEIKNPLSNTYSLVQLLEDENLSEEASSNIKLIKQSIEHVKEIEKDFNEYIKFGKTSINCSTVNVGQLLEATIAEYKWAAYQKNITIISNIKVCRVHTDATKLKQVISNLISNAVKYTKPFGQINISCYSIVSGAQITISDNGIGMTEEELKQLGIPFYRCKKMDVEGTGLGISTVKKIVNLFGWQLDIKSTPNVGSNFTLKVISK
jgi:two-component system sporulation sensor kinase B